MLAQRDAHRMDGVGIDHVHLLGDVALGRQRQRLGGEGRIARAVVQYVREGARERVGELGPAAGLMRRYRAQQEVDRQTLAGFPAVERVAVVGEQVGQRVVVVVVLHDHRRGEAAQQRRHRRARHVDEGEALAVAA